MFFSILVHIMSRYLFISFSLSITLGYMIGLGPGLSQAMSSNSESSSSSLLPCSLANWLKRFSNLKSISSLSVSEFMMYDLSNDGLTEVELGFMVLYKIITRKLYDKSALSRPEGMFVKVMDSKIHQMFHTLNISFNYVDEWNRCGANI